MYTLKCVSLALSVESRRDRVIINQMESLADMFRMEFQNDMNAVNTDLKYSKQYRITKYFVKDLENVPLKYRYTKKWSEVEVPVYSHSDRLINEINIAFSMCAQRFITDPMHSVYHYGWNN
ncbi:uncharacterized protein LOC112693966 [Sipha flava]|uniref:Uncharacterized protein LOC112693966 n=2 Tax=Sipha flava TaxID=143950 RepID=A0A8B8GPU4_9HEMI|nr:uncharacterized protein LOC112693966 [Sipha flava]XP_025425046.1 uncharacterized protein LOC112693966 [Sipha flava]